LERLDDFKMGLCVLFQNVVYLIRYAGILSTRNIMLIMAQPKNLYFAIGYDSTLSIGNFELINADRKRTKY
jgi:hypothetical protein